MTREEKATLRAQARERRRRPRDEDPAVVDGAEEDDSHGEEEPAQPREDGRQPRAKREPLRGAPGDELEDLASQAKELLRSVRGVEAESVSGLARTSNGWSVTLEVVELRRIPESTDVLASYEVQLDDDSNFLGFSRGRRYNRSQAEGSGR
jgi:Gas vesicle synthesis protein GvpO